MTVQGQGQRPGRKQSGKSWFGVQNPEPGPERSWADGKGGPGRLKRKPGCGSSSSKLRYSRHSAAAVSPSALGTSNGTLRTC